MQGFTPGHYPVYVDNVDHNVTTLDGFSTFHCMGVVATVTLGIEHQTPVPNQIVSSKDLAVKANITLQIAMLHDAGSLPRRISTLIHPISTNVGQEFQWHELYSTLIFVCAEAKHHDVWLPVSLVSHHDVIPVIASDQPLWWKAQTIITIKPLESNLHCLVLRLGGFYTKMRFFGSYMSGSGLQDWLIT